MSVDPGVVIVGAGQGGFQVAVSLREGGYDGPVVLVGDEAGLPYERPPLSKSYLTGQASDDSVLLRPARYFQDHGIEVVRGQRVQSLDRSARSVTLDDGRRLPYGHLVLATGTRPRPLPVPGAELAGVHTLRTLTDAAALRSALAGVQHVVVVGGGFIGLEFASVATGLGLSTVVVEAAPRPMARALSEPMSAWFAGAHRGRGVRLLLDEGVARIDGRDGRVVGVTTRSGREVPADVVLVGIGVVPNDELAAAAGLATDDGVVVDGLMVTSDPDVSAVGDCAAFVSPSHGRRIRIESVQNATDQARTVAARLTGTPAPYSAVPWFWSDQGDWRLQIVGMNTDCDTTVVRGDPDAARFSVFCFRGGELVSVESVNRAADHVVGRRLLAAGHALTPEQAADPAFDLKTHARQAATSA